MRQTEAEHLYLSLAVKYEMHLFRISLLFKKKKCIPNFLAARLLFMTRGRTGLSEELVMGEGGPLFADATLASARWAGGVGWRRGGSSREPEVQGVSGRQPPSGGWQRAE